MNHLTNFEQTLAELKKYLSMPIQNDRDIAGIIQAFEFTFEQSWKSVQKIAGELGGEAANPKSAFTYAMQNSWIQKNDEEKWLQMIRDRNMTSHTYKKHLASEVLGRIQKDYIAMFEALKAKLSEEV